MIVSAASVVPFCEVPRLSVLWARRGDDAPQLPGFHAAPGGAIDPSDASAPNDGGDDIAARVAALRELFEELGILWVHGDAGDVRAELRECFDESAELGHARMAELGLVWRTAELTPVGRWVTPAYVPRRFDARFFALRLERPIEPDPDLFEVERAEWIEPSRALARWAKAEVLLAPSLTAILRSLARHGALRADELWSVYGAQAEHSLRWEVVPFVQVLPLRTPTLPPATHTNSFLVGSGQALLVEPATPYPEELDRMVAWVDEAKEDGIAPIAIFATHHHIDHIGGARELAKRLSLPLWGHRLTAERLRGHVAFDRLLEDGERIELDGPEPMTLRALHTPGHAPGHLCAIEERSAVMIAGDMVAGEGTILIEPTDGDMSLYLASLQRMAEQEPSMLLPAHGMVMREPRRVLDHYVAHRLAREKKVLEALRAQAGPASAAELLPLAYDDAPRAVWPIAALSAEAHLIKLEREGLARRLGDRWSLT